MSFTVTIKASGHQFSTEPGECILDAADRQGIMLPYGCRNGLCGSCAGTLVTGTVDYPDEFGEDFQGLPMNRCLPCQAMPTSDVVIDIHEVESNQEVAARIIPCQIARKEQLAHDVMRIYLELPKDQRLQFFAGQYLDFLLSDGRRRAFSIANAPHDDAFIELHIRHVPGGEFTDYVFNQMREGSIQRIEAPKGAFYLRESSGRPLIMMAGGTGFAPLKGIIEHAFHIKDDRPIHLYWGVRSARDIYLPDLPNQWIRARPHFQYTPVLSEPDSNWEGRIGWVHEAVLQDFSDLTDFDLYMSGPPPMVYAGHKAFLAAGLREEHMYSDVFEWAKDNPAIKPLELTGKAE
ncbi:MAG: CDP-6-deoxy-delta-3,4-glucoseen reductase [Gammaproteobacteria bacterium]|nr:CDP-6-deoxy-delta-3,4-glucoseen reductase [Gammaproteobacteria bacterium]